ncbi:MAG: peptidyl-tRNA hydrolase [Candidatus Bathyarchaeota archaeon]|nr:MAG: peptidyl-tRNA hydrolase [Candidatus Bathyarchaeota archaeon]
MFRTKQVIVVRKDLKMGLGKLVSQACHACLEASEIVRKQNLRLWTIWHEEGAKKIIVKIDSHENLLKLKEEAQKLGVAHRLIVDKGLTQLPPNTPTSLGIGPSESGVIDKMTKCLKLL